MENKNKINQEKNKEIIESKKDISLKTKRIEEFSWRAPEFNVVKKNINWYIYLTIISLILIVTAILQKNFLFLILILLIVAFLIYSNNKKPRILEIKILSDGIEIEKDFFLKFEELQGFSFYEREGLLDELVLKKKSGLNNLIFLPVDEKTKEKVREILKEKIEEFKYEPTLSEILFEKYF